MPVDWYALERALVSPASDSESYLDTRTGEVVSLTYGWSEEHDFSEQELAEGLVCGRLVPIEPLPPEVEREWICAFAVDLERGWARDALRQALGADAPRRRFEEALGRFPQERVRWLAAHEAHVMAVLRRWLEENEIEPTSEPFRGSRLIRPRLL